MTRPKGGRDIDVSAKKSHFVSRARVPQLLESLLDLEDLGVAVLSPQDGDYRYVYLNAGAGNLFPGMQIEGRTLREVWSPRGAAGMSAAFDRVLSTGEPWFHYEQPVPRMEREGPPSTRYLTFHAWRAIFQGVAYVACTIWDVTERVEARMLADEARRDLKASEGVIRAHEHESKLLQAANRILQASLTATSQRQLGSVCLEAARELTDSAIGFLGTLDDDGRLRDIAMDHDGRAACRMPKGSGHGRQGAVVCGRTCDQMLSTGQTVRLNHLSAGGEGVVLPEGHPVLRSFLGVPLKHGEKTMGVIAVGNRKGGYRNQDASLLEALEPAISSALMSYRTVQRLEESTKLLNAHMSNSPVAIVEFDTDFRVTRWSQESERIFGYSAEEILGRRIADMPWVYEEDTALVNVESARLYSGMVTRSKNVNRNYRKDGSVIWCEWYSSAIHDERGRLTSVLSLVLDITARTKAQEQAKRQAERLVALKQVGDAAASALEVRELGDRLAAAIAAASHADVAMLVVPNETGELIAVGSYGYPADSVHVTEPLPPESGTARVFRACAPVYAADLSASVVGEISARNAAEMGVSSLTGIPLCIEGKPIGVVTMGWRERQEFDAEEAPFLESLAGEIAVGLQNALLYEAERERRRRIQDLHGVLEVAVASLDPADAAQHILGYLQDHRTFDLANVWIARGESLELLACVNYPYGYREQFSPMPLEAPYDAAKVYKTGTSTVVPNLAKSQQAVRDMYAAIDVELGAYVIVPLRSRGHTVGTLDLGWHQPRPISAADVAFYESIGGELGVVLENAELLSDLTQQAKYAEALNRINEAVHSTLDFDEIMRRVVVDAAEAAGFDGSGVYLRQGDTWSFPYTYGLPDELRGLSHSDETKLSLGVLAVGQAQVVPDAKADESADSALFRRFDISSVLAVPLITRGERVGVLFACYFGDSSHDFGEWQVDFLKKVASTVSLAIDNARLYSVERSIADRLQGALLTMPRKVPGIEHSHAYRSATEAAWVGGDFYDLFELGGERVGIVIGDVAGKGVDAAVLTSLVKNTIRAHASEPGKTPAQILELANDVVYKSTPMDAFVTVFFGVLDTSDGAFFYANAGHTSGAVVRFGEPATALRVTGPLLGAFGAARYVQAGARLGFGDVLFLYTDGLTEARRQGEMFGEERLREVLSNVEPSSTDAVLAEVVSEVVAFSDGHLNDDVAILVVKLVEHETPGPRQQTLDV